MPIIKLSPQFFNHDAQAGGFFPNTHINQSFDIEKFIQQRGKNSIIEGIRGTGKTHILKMVAERYLENFSTYRVLPVYVSLAKLSQFSEEDIKRFRMQLYANIVLESINCIEQHKEALGSPEKMEAIGALSLLKKLFGIKPETDFEGTIREIKQLNQSLLQKLTYNPQGISMRQADTAKSGIQTTLATPVGSAAAEVSAESETEQKVDFIGTSLSHENAAEFILEYFKQLKKILSLSFSLILLDECSETSKDGQIEVFRLLKLIRGASDADIKQNFAYFLAAAYPPQATYYPSRIHGDSFNFELGNDASVDYLQLDETLEEYESFFSELTRKRLLYLGGNGFAALHDPNILDIFDSDRAFILAAYAANGIPRRYIEILKQAYDNLQQRTMGTTTEAILKISLRDVEEAIQTVVSSSILVHNKLDTKDFTILDEIVNRFAKRNKRVETENKEKEVAVPAIVYFTTSRSQVNDLANLIVQGALHDKARTRVRKFYREDSFQGELMSLDLAVAFYNSAIDKNRATEIFKKDLRDNQKRGYIACLDFDLTKFKAFKHDN